MNSDVRRVTIFFTVGLLAAAAVGFGVWRMGSPSSVNADPTITTQTSSVNTSTEKKDAQTTEESETQELREQESVPAQAAAPNYGDDPFLAPNSVVNPQRETPTPTNVYRPEPIFGEEYDSYAQSSGAQNEFDADGDENQTEEALTSDSEATQSPDETTDGSAPSTSPDQDGDDNVTTRPSGPSEEPTEPNESTQPAEPSEPVETSKPTQPGKPVNPAAPTESLKPQTTVSQSPTTTRTQQAPATTGSSY
ncbi:hypothetical protein [Corynebacterium stationis]|uniref:hypothetical protein n=1 Tax=Corynebacterium stationis TaxID=1705 RepID=UPI00242FB08D|nr:hypothetical protein [Corynebacterium stationis]